MAKQTLFDVAKTVLPVGTGSSSAHEPEKKKKKKQTLFDIEQEVLGGARADAIDRLRAPQPAPSSRALLPRAPASAAFQRRTPQPAPQYTRQETAPITPTGRMAQSYPAITVTPDPVYAEERAQRQADRATARERQYSEFMALKDTPDFQKYADIGAALENPSWQEADSSLRPGIFGWRPFSKPLENKVKFYKEYPAADTEAYGLMTDDEYATYNYLLGRGTYDDADAFLEIVKPRINERVMSGFIDETTSMAEESPVSASALSLITAPVQGVGALYSYGTALTGGEVDPNHPLFAISRANQAIRGTVGGKISEGAGGGFLGDALAFVYGTGMSIGDFLISRQLSVGAGEDMSKMMTGIMGTRAATDMTLSAYDRGATQNEALVLGALAGAAEIFFERFSIESFERMRLSPPSVKGALFKNILKQGGVEATEEMATELAKTLSDLLVMGDRSEFAIVQSQYENMGMSRQEAAAQAVIGLLGKVGLAGLGGLLSGGVLGAFSTGKAAKTGDAAGEYTGSDTANDTAYQSEFDAQVTELGRKAIEFGTVDSLLAAARQTNPDGAAYQAAQFVVSSDARTSASAVGNLVFEYTLETGDARFVTPVTADYTVADMQRDTAPGANLPAVLDTDQSLDTLRQAALDSYQPQDAAFTPEIAPAADVVREPDIIPAEPEQPLESQFTAQEAASVESAVEPEPVAAPEARAPVTKPGVVRKYSQSAFSALAPDARKRARAEFAALDMMAKKYDLKIEIVDKIDLADANGMYNPKTGRITVALDAVEGAYMYIGMHEMTHHIRSTTPEAYDLLEFMVLEILKENGTDVEAAIAEQMKLNNASREDATEEVVANSVGAVLADPEAVEKLVTDNPSLARRIWEFIKKLVADMRDMIKRLSKHKGFEQAGALAENAKALQEIATLFDYALADAQTVTAGGALDVLVGGEVSASKKGETKLNEAVELSDATTKYSLRTEPEPKNTIKGYKVFVAFKNKPGELYPPMVANPNGESTPVGVWLNADAGVAAADSKTGRPQVKAGGKGTQGGSGSLAYRPGWHLGDLPFATQFSRLNKETGKKELFPENFIWAECECAADLDYQEEAMSYGYTENGSFRHSYAGLPHLPRESDGMAGFYRYRTNPDPNTIPWIITGAMKVTRILDDSETDALLRANGIEPQQRQGAPINLADYGLKAGRVDSRDDKIVKFSRKDSAGRELTQEQAEFFKNSKAVDANGNLLRLYHGSSSYLKYEVFKTTEDYRQGLYLATNKDVAKVFANGRNTADTNDFTLGNADDVGGSNGVYILYANVLNPLILDADGRRYDALDNALGIPGHNTLDTQQVVRYARENGHDGAIIKNVRESIGVLTDDVVVFNPNAVKYVDNKTPTGSPDIRFSRRKPWGIIETDEQQLRREVNLRDTEIEKLRATVESLRAELKPSVGFTPTPHSVSKIAGNLLNTTMSAYPRKELTERLTEYYTNLGNGLFNDADADDTLAPLYELMRDVLDEYKVESVIPNAPEMKKYLRNTELTIGTQDRGEIEASFGSYKHFRQLLSGKLKVKLDPDAAIGNIEDVWEEFHNAFYGPNMVDEYGSEMLHSLIETVEMLYENPTNNPYGYSKDEYASELAADAFIDFYTDVAKKTTFADRAQAKYDALVKKARADIAAVRADARERHNAHIKTLREEQRARVKALVEQHKRIVDDLNFERRAELLMQRKNLMNKHYLRMEEQRMEFRDWKTRDRLRRKNTEQRNKTLKRIKKKAADFNAWLARPTKEHHVPEFLRNGLTEVLDGINMSLKPGAKMEAKWQEQVYKLVKMLNDVFDPQVKEQREMLNNLMPSVVPFMTTVLDGLNARRGRMVLNIMTLADLEALDESLSVVWHAVKSINRAYSVHKFKTISALGDATVSYADGKKQASEGGRVSRYFNLDMLEPITYLHEFGPAGDALFKAFSVGESKTLTRGRESQDFFAALKKKLSVDGGTIRKWSDTAHEIALESGKTIRMTVPNVMEFYAHMNREQSVGHIYDGGIVVRTTDGSERTRKRQADVFKITPKDADKIVETLTDKQRELISAMQRFLSEDVAGWGNETTMELYLFKMFREKNYWPIRVIEGSIPIEQALADEPIFNALLNASFTKHTTAYAANPILISDAFGTFIDHVSRMAAFNGLGPVVQDALRWANYVQVGDDGKPVYDASVRKAMNNMLGPGGERYFRNFMRSMNSAEQGSFSTDISRKLISNMKVSSIAGSLRVVIQQPTAVGRAAAEINPLYLVRGATGKQRIREMQRYAPIAWIKGNGRFDIGLGRSWRDIVIGDSSILEKGSEWLLAPAGWADNVTWAVIWNAVRLETADLHPELEIGTQAFFDAVSSRFTDIIDRTQVVDTTLRRSQAMRSQDLLLQTATAFMSEPTKTYNMAYRAMRDATYHKTPKAKRVLARSLMAALFAQALTAFVVSLWDAGRKPDEDKEFWEKVGENWTSEMIVDTLSAAPYVRDIVSIIEGYDAERMDMKAVATTIQWLGRVGGILQTGDTGKYSMYKHATDGAKALSDLFGLPVRGTLTSFESIARMVNPDVLPVLSDTPVTLYNTIRAGEKANAAKMYDALVKERIRYINREETKRRNDGVPEQYADAASVKTAAMEYVDSGVAELLADDPEIADAYKYRKAGQKSKVDAVYRALESEGFTRNAVTRAIARYENKIEKKPPETQEYTDKKRFKNEHLFEAVRNGNASDVAGIYDELVRDSTADDPIQSLRNSATIEFKPDYIRYVENGDTKKAAKLADVLITHFGHTQEQLDQWVRNARSEEMHEAIEDGDVEATNKAIARQIADGKKRGDIAASITSKYKPLIIDAYVSGDREELAALVKMLTDLPLVNDKGNPYYTTTIIWGWIEKYLSDLG